MPNGFGFGFASPFSALGGGVGGLLNLMAAIEKTVQGVVTAPLSGLGVKPSQLPPGPATLLSGGLPKAAVRTTGTPVRPGGPQAAPASSTITVV